MVTIQSNLCKIHKKIGVIFIAMLLLGAFSATYADKSNDYSTLTIAAKADKKSNGGGGIAIP